MKSEQINMCLYTGETPLYKRSGIMSHINSALRNKNNLKNFIDSKITEKYLNTKKIILTFLLFSICLVAFSSPMQDCEVSANAYEYTMSIVGYANESVTETIGEMIGVSLKMNGECRGYSTFSMYNDRPIIYLTAYSNVSQGEELSVVLHGTSGTLTSSVMLPFVSNQILGFVSNPVNLFRESEVLNVYEGTSNIKFDDLVRLSSQGPVAYIEGLSTHALDYQVLSASGQVLDYGTMKKGIKKNILLQFGQLYIVCLSGSNPSNNRQFQLFRKIIFKP